MNSKLYLFFFFSAINIVLANPKKSDLPDNKEVSNLFCGYLIPPTNDNCGSAIDIVVGAPAITGTVLDATQSIPGVNCGGFTGDANYDVWYKFTTTGAGSYIINVNGSLSFDAVIDLRSGSCNGTNLFCADGIVTGGQETLTATGLSANTTYYIRIYDYEAGIPATPTFTVSVNIGVLSTNSFSNLTSAIFPNPVVNNELYVNFENDEKADYLITNLLGQTIQNGELKGLQNKIALSNFSKGLYVLIISQSGKSQSTKIYVE